MSMQQKCTEHWRRSKAIRSFAVCFVLLALMGCESELRIEAKVQGPNDEIVTVTGSSRDVQWLQRQVAELRKVAGMARSAYETYRDAAGPLDSLIREKAQRDVHTWCDQILTICLSSRANSGLVAVNGSGEILNNYEAFARTTKDAVPPPGN